MKDKRLSNDANSTSGTDFLKTLFNFRTPNDNLVTQDSNSSKFEGDRMNQNRGTWKKAPLVQSRSVDGSAMRRNATVTTAPIQSKSQAEVKELDLVSHNQTAK